MLDEYKTGNKKMDEKIERAIRKDPRWSNSNTPFEAYDLLDTPKRNKYGVSAIEDRTYQDGVVFASKREMERWDYLLQIQNAGEITDLQRQVPFVLQESFISKQYGDVQHIVYVADFTYTNISYRRGYEGRLIVEDSKGGIRTPAYQIKRKLFLYKYANYLFFEV